MRQWKPWEIAATIAGAVIAICGAAAAAFAIFQFSKSKQLSQRNDDYVW